MTARRTSTREALLDTAARLMDERGVDQVSLNEINRASGSRNRSAASYHFVSRDAIVREVMQRTMTTIETQRNVLLNHLELTRQQLDARDAVQLVIGPLARQLMTAEGRRFLRLCGQLINHPRYNTDARELVGINTSIRRCAVHLAPALAHLQPVLRLERTSQIISFAVRSISDQARLMDTDPPPRPRLTFEAFTANLIDTILGMLSAPTTISSDAELTDDVL